MTRRVTEGVSRSLSEEKRETARSLPYLKDGIRDFKANLGRDSDHRPSGLRDCGLFTVPCFSVSWPSR